LLASYCWDRVFHYSGFPAVFTEPLPTKYHVLSHY
jgi:hypothetical protein